MHGNTPAHEPHQKEDAGQGMYSEIAPNALAFPGSFHSRIILQKINPSSKLIHAMITLVLLVVILNCLSAGWGHDEDPGYKDGKEHSNGIKQGVISLSGASRNGDVHIASNGSHVTGVNNGSVIYSDGRRDSVKRLYADDTWSDLLLFQGSCDVSCLSLATGDKQDYRYGNATCVGNRGLGPVSGNITDSLVNYTCYCNDLPGQPSTGLLSDSQYYHIPGAVNKLKVRADKRTETEHGCGDTTADGVSTDSQQFVNSTGDNSTTHYTGHFTGDTDRTGAKSGGNQYSAEACGDPTFLHYTFVTGLFDLHREKWPHFRRGFDHYLNYSVQLLHMNVPLIAYIDAKSEEFVRQHRRHKENFTKLIVTSVEELEYYEDYNTIKGIMDSKEFQTDHAFLHHPEAFSPEYNILLNSKSSMLYRASLENPFNSSHFFWVDMGYGHGEDIYPEQCDWAPNNLIYNDTVADKITFIQLNPIAWLSSIFEVYKKKIPPFLNGGFFGGSLEAVKRYYNVHRDMYKLLLLHEMTDDDQTVAIVCYFHQKEIFNLIDGWWYDAFTLFH